MATTTTQSVAKAAIGSLQKAPFKVGQKQVFLPNFEIVLLRTPKLPATFASFIVPLNLNKLDLKDYLWHAYNVPVKSVRSYIQRQKLTQGKPSERRPRPRQFYRPRSIKKMMVEMDKPFVWPEEPKDYEPWDKKSYDASQKARDDESAQARPDAREKPSKERASIAKQAQALLRGKSSWKVNEESVEWEDDGEAVEVEKDIKV